MRVDPAFHALLADPRVHLRRPAPPLTVPQLREAANAFMARAAGPAMASVTDRSVTGPDGQPIALRVYEPVQGAYASARIVFCHEIGRAHV